MKTILLLAFGLALSLLGMAALLGGYGDVWAWIGISLGSAIISCASGRQVTLLLAENERRAKQVKRG
ncbi:MAG TPA: hypothetical protein VKS79_21040 [Gemmataceae bacterium]|nr:hypothetical protein [Gemmataceae bacterium]